MVKLNESGFTEEVYRALALNRGALTPEITKRSGINPERDGERTIIMKFA